MLYYPYHPHQPFGDGFKADNDTQAGFFHQFAEFLAAEPPLNGEQLLYGIREAMSASHFVHPDIGKKLPIYHNVVTFLERYSITVRVTQESGKLPARRLIYRIWSSTEHTRDRSLALRTYDNIRNGYYVVLASPIGYTSVMQGVFGTPRCENGYGLREETSRSAWPTSRSLAKSIAERISSEALKIGGQAEQRWNQYLDNYVGVTPEMEQTNNLKMKGSHQVLRDHALDIYRDFGEGANSWGEVLRIVSDEVSSNARKRANMGRLRSLRINQKASEHYTELEVIQLLFCQASTVKGLILSATTLFSMMRRF